MSPELAQLLPTLHNLKRAEKLVAMQVLLVDLLQEEKADITYPIWSSYDPFDAADQMIKALSEKKAKK